jgi:hypothetical protein
MTIDCTLFAQMLNFFGAYLILRWFLFKPVIAVIDAESREEKRINETIHSFEASVHAIHNEQQALWNSFHNSVVHEVSSIQESEHPADTRAVVVDISTTSTAQRENLSKICAEHLVEKVKYVRK